MFGVYLKIERDLVQQVPLTPNMGPTEVIIDQNMLNTTEEQLKPSWRENPRSMSLSL